MNQADPALFRDVLAALGWARGEAAVRLYVGARTLDRWADRPAKIPPGVWRELRHGLRNELRRGPVAMSPRLTKRVSELIGRIEGRIAAAEGGDAKTKNLG